VSLINRKQVRALALAHAKATRAKGFTRVGKSFCDRVEARLRSCVLAEVDRHPSVGVTLK